MILSYTFQGAARWNSCKGTESKQKPSSNEHRQVLIAAAKHIWVLEITWQDFAREMTSTFLFVGMQLICQWPIAFQDVAQLKSWSAMFRTYLLKHVKTISETCGGPHPWAALIFLPECPLMPLHDHSLLLNDNNANSKLKHPETIPQQLKHPDMHLNSCNQVTLLSIGMCVANHRHQCCAAHCWEGHLVSKSQRNIHRIRSFIVKIRRGTNRTFALLHFCWRMLAT